MVVVAVVVKEEKVLKIFSSAVGFPFYRRALARQDVSKRLCAPKVKWKRHPTVACFSKQGLLASLSHHIVAISCFELGRLS